MFLLAWACLISLSSGKDWPSLCNSSNSTYEYRYDNYFDIQNDLTHKLFDNYNRSIPAVYFMDNFGKIVDPELRANPLEVKLTLIYFRFLLMDEEKQSAIMLMEMHFEWTDPRLKWNVSEYCGLKTIALTNKETVWTPDIYPYTTISVTDVLPEAQQTVKIRNDGKLSMYKSMVIDFVCLTYLNTYPFDEQKCSMTFGSLNYPRSEMILKGYIMDYSKTWTDGKWTISTVNYGTAKNFKLSIDGEKYSSIAFRFWLKRVSVYYFIFLIIPSFILTILCFIGLFWMPINSENYMDNLNLGFAAILAMMLNLQMGTQDIPKANKVDKLSIFLLTNLCLIALAICVVLVLGKLSRRYNGKGKKDTEKEKSRRLLAFLFFKHAHLILMISFNIMAIVNLVILLVNDQKPNYKDAS